MTPATPAAIAETSSRSTSSTTASKTAARRTDPRQHHAERGTEPAADRYGVNPERERHPEVHPPAPRHARQRTKDHRSRARSQAPAVTIELRRAGGVGDQHREQAGGSQNRKGTGNRFRADAHGASMGTGVR